jgi:hypothetical protein
MKKVEPFSDLSPIQFITMRQSLGLGRYIRIAPRDPEKWKILLRLYLNIMTKHEQDDYLLLGRHRRRIRTL